MPCPDESARPFRFWRQVWSRRGRSGLPLAILCGSPGWPRPTCLLVAARTLPRSPPVRWRCLASTTNAAISPTPSERSETLPGRSGDPPRGPEAAEHYRSAISVAAELGMRPLVAHCHAGLAKLYSRTGRREDAHEHLTTARTMYREMGMTYWLEKAEEAVKELA